MRFRFELPRAAWPVVLACFALFYFAASEFHARVTGWRALARRYPDQPMSVDRRLRGRVTTGNISLLAKGDPWTLIEVGDRGVRISPSLWARFAHPPFLIPWRAVQRCEPAPADWVRVRIRAEGVDQDVAVFLRNAVVVLRACREHQAGSAASAA